MRRGVTLLELLMVIGILSILFTVSTMSFSGIVGRSGLDATAAQIKSTLQKAQQNAQNGKNGGVYFGTDSSYTYFWTTSYVEGELTNEIVNLPSGYRISSNTFPADTAIFNHVTGWLSGYVDPAEVVLTDTGNGASRVVNINPWGIIDVSY
jgi:prepilin-type N-terminal cleavage/methylation domain-containing protein